MRTWSADGFLARFSLIYQRRKVDAMLISCTKKIADSLNIKMFEVVPIRREPLFEWHANLFEYQNRKGVIMMNNQTRYSVVLYGLLAEQFQMFKTLLLFAIELTFCAEGFRDDVIARYLRQAGEVVFVQSNDRSILSQMNYIQYHLERRIERQLPSENIYMIELSKELSRLPMEKHLNNRAPIELLWEGMHEV